MDPKHKILLSVSKKEFMNNVRNKWIFVLTLIFVGSILLTSAYGGIEARGDAGIKGFEFTMRWGSSMVVLLIPIVAIMLGYKAIVDEVEAGNIGLILTSKLDRSRIVAAKFLGLAAVLSTAVVGGLAIGGLFIGIVSGFEGGLDYIYFVLFSLMLSLAYLTMAFTISAVVRKKTHALAGGIFLWVFFNIIYELVLFGVLIASGWELPDGPFTELTFPDWFRYASLSNPSQVFELGVFGILDLANLPDLMNLPFLFFVLFLWIAIPLALSSLIFKKKDL